MCERDNSQLLSSTMCLYCTCLQTESSLYFMYAPTQLTAPMKERFSFGFTVCPDLEINFPSFIVILLHRHFPIYGSNEGEIWLKGRPSSYIYIYIRMYKGTRSKPLRSELAVPLISYLRMFSFPVNIKVNACSHLQQYRINPFIYASLSVCELYHKKLHLCNNAYEILSCCLTASLPSGTPKHQLHLLCISCLPLEFHCWPIDCFVLFSAFLQ